MRGNGAVPSKDTPLLWLVTWLRSLTNQGSQTRWITEISPDSTASKGLERPSTPYRCRHSLFDTEENAGYAQVLSFVLDDALSEDAWNIIDDSSYPIKSSMSSTNHSSSADQQELRIRRIRQACRNCRYEIGHEIE